MSVSLSLPVVGGDFNAWGGELNAALTALAEAVDAAQEAAAAAGSGGLTVFDVRAYGAVGDGTADDTVAFADAAAAADAAGGGIIQVPAGTWRTSILLPAKCVLRGVGRATIIQPPTGFTGDIIALDGDAYGFAIENLVVDGSTATSGRGIALITNGDAFQAGEPTYDNMPDPVPWLSNVVVRRTKGDGIYAGQNMRELKAWNVYVLYAGGSGIKIGAHDSQWTGCAVGGSYYEGWLITGRNNRLVGCKSFYSGVNSSGVLTAGGRGVGFDVSNAKNVLVGCESQENSDVGVYLHALDGSTITGHQFGGDRTTALYVAGTVTAVSVQGTLVATELRYSPTTYGLFLDSTTISGCTFDLVTEASAVTNPLQLGGGVAGIGSNTVLVRTSSSSGFGVRELAQTAITGAFSTTSSSYVDSGLNLTVPCNGEVVVLEFDGGVDQSVAGAYSALQIIDSDSSTVLADFSIRHPYVTSSYPVHKTVRLTPAKGTRHYRVVLAAIGGGTARIVAGSTAPATFRAVGQQLA